MAASARRAAKLKAVWRRRHPTAINRTSAFDCQWLSSRRRRAFERENMALGEADQYLRKARAVLQRATASAGERVVKLIALPSRNLFAVRHVYKARRSEQRWRLSSGRQEGFTQKFCGGEWLLLLAARFARRGWPSSMACHTICSEGGRGSGRGRRPSCWKRQSNGGVAAS